MLLTPDTQLYKNTSGGELSHGKFSIQLFVNTRLERVMLRPLSCDVSTDGKRSKGARPQADRLWSPWRWIKVYPGKWADDNVWMDHWTLRVRGLIRSTLLLMLCCSWTWKQMSNEDCLHYCSCIKETAAFNATHFKTNTVLMNTFRHSFAFRPAFMNKVAPTSLDLNKPLGKVWPDFSCEGKVHKDEKSVIYRLTFMSLQTHMNYFLLKKTKVCVYMNRISKFMLSRLKSIILEKPHKWINLGFIQKNSSPTHFR